MELDGVLIQLKSVRDRTASNYSVDTHAPAELWVSSVTVTTGRFFAASSAGARGRSCTPVERQCVCEANVSEAGESLAVCDTVKLIFDVQSRSAWS